MNRRNDGLGPLWTAAARYASIAVIGLHKNAGKTTVLGALLRALGEMDRRAGVTSIGRDGEAVDAVTGTEKPGVWVRAESLVATATQMLPLGDFTPEILSCTGVHTPLGEVCIARALSGGWAHLAGPSMTAQMAALVRALLALGAQTVLIDGAAGRRSLAAPAVSEAAVLCVGASYHPDMRRVIEDTAYACALLTLPAAKADETCHVMEGALTETALQALSLHAGDAIVIEDASRALISRAAYERLLARGARLTVRRAGTLCCVCVNPHAVRGPGFDADAFLTRMREAVPVPVLNVKEPKQS